MSSNGPVLDLIRERGFWKVVIRPTEFDNKRLGQSELKDALDRSRVSLRGWDFPHVNQREPVERHRDHIAQSTDWNHYLEHWRLYRSGQFVYLGAIGDDWRDRSDLWPGDFDPAEPRLSFVGTIYRMTEFFEFAARLALTDAGAAGMYVSVGVRGLEGRALYSDHSRILIDPRPGAAEDRWDGVWSGTTEELVAQRSRLATPFLVELFWLFGFDIQEEVITYHQDRLLEGNP